MEIKKIVATIAMAGFPYLSCETVLGKYNTVHSEIRVGGRDCHDGFLSNIKSSLGNERWTGHFYGVKFSLSAENTCWLVENAYDVAYLHGFKGRKISDADVEKLQ